MFPALGLLLLSTLLALFCAGYPLFVIRPFRPQGERELALALAVIEWRDWILPLCLLLSLVACYFLWRRSSRWPSRLGLSIPLLLTVLAAASTRINVFERMFSPIPDPRFQAASTVSLSPAARVLSIRLSGQARAYPVSYLAYHHLVNDTLAGHPVIATY